MRIVELPLPLCPTGKLALAILVARPSMLHTGLVVWLGDNYDFDGSTPPATYQVMTAHGGFAKSGLLLSDYPSDTNTLDFNTRLHLQMTGADLTLDEQTSTNGLANDLLVFVGAEIMSVIGIELIGPSSYRLQLVRGRFGTVPEMHEVGAEVFIVAREDLLALTHPTFQPGETITLKVALSKNRFTQDLGEVEPTEHEIAGTALQPAPLNLWVNGKLRNQVFTPAADVLVEWSLPELRATIETGFGYKVRTLFEIVSVADPDQVLWSKLTFDAYMKIGGVKMDTIRGAETSFTVRLQTDVLAPDWRLSSEPITTTVNQI